MMPLVFEETLTQMRRQEPFQPFVVELLNGNRINVEHPEALAYSQRRAVYVGKHGSLHIFDPDGVNQIILRGKNGSAN